MTKDEALRLALWALDSVLANHKGAPVLPWIEARDAIKAALEAKDEPVAWMSPSWIDPDTRGWQSDSFESIPIEGWLPIYTTTPQRTWVGLTDEDFENAFQETYIMGDSDLQDFAKVIEAKLKEKNT
jgi:hypothetical protein